MHTESRTSSLAVTFTLDIEPFAAPGMASRHVELTETVLEGLASRGITGTMFIVGEVAEAHPELVRNIRDAGHELGLHAQRHIALAEVGSNQFLSETRDAKHRLEDLAQSAITGYRAPMMSLVPETAWAIPMLTEAGFTYSSSVLPARSPHYGWPGLPLEPFRWLDGPVELPCPLAGIGPIRIPFLGGTYLRLLPTPLAKLLQARANPDQLRWAYCHPYEFDPSEPRWIDPSVGKLGSWMLWYGRRHTWRNLDRVMQSGGGPTLIERVATLPDDLPVIDPSHFQR